MLRGLGQHSSPIGIAARHRSPGFDRFANLEPGGYASRVSRLGGSGSFPGTVTGGKEPEPFKTRPPLQSARLPGSFAARPVSYDRSGKCADLVVLEQNVFEVTTPDIYKNKNLHYDDERSVHLRQVVSTRHAASRRPC